MLAWALATLTVTDGVLGLAALRRRSQTEAGPAVGILLPPTGSASEGSGGRAAWPRCEVLRYSALRCPFCSAQAAAGWRNAAAALAGVGCEIAEIAPFGGNLPLDGLRLPHRVLLTVSPDFAAATRFTRTPTTAIVIRGRVVWERVGIIGPAGVRSALYAAEAGRR